MSPDLPARVPEGDGAGASVLADPLEGPHQVRLAVAPALLYVWIKYKLLPFISNLPKFWNGHDDGKTFTQNLILSLQVSAATLICHLRLPFTFWYCNRLTIKIS